MRVRMGKGMRCRSLAMLTCEVVLCVSLFAEAQPAQAALDGEAALWVAAKPAEAESEDAVNALLQSCWMGNDHLRTSACVARTSRMARAELQHAEAAFRQGIARQTERSRAQRQQLMRALNASTHAHATYRQAMCAQRRALASLGNGEVDNGLACEAVLDRQRVQALQADAGYL